MLPYDNIILFGDDLQGPFILPGLVSSMLDPDVVIVMGMVGYLLKYRWTSPFFVSL